MIRRCIVEKCVKGLEKAEKETCSFACLAMFPGDMGLGVAGSHSRRVLSFLPRNDGNDLSLVWHPSF